MSEQPADTTEELKDNYVGLSGTACPTFVTQSVFEQTDDEHIHHVTFPDPAPHTRGDGRITIRGIIVTDQGGVVTYDDDATIFQRMFTDPEQAVRTFRATVTITAAKSGGPTPVYDPGFEPVSFDDVTIEVQD